MEYLENKIKFKPNYYKNMYCNNCGIKGHMSKKCTRPISSYGVIAVNMYSLNYQQKLNIFDILNNHYTNTFNEIKLKDKDTINLFCELKNSTSFLMVSRKHSIGYTEFLRGRYRIDDYNCITVLFRQMLESEKNKLLSLSFKELWDDMWSSSTNPITFANKLYKNDYLVAQKKFEKIKNPQETDIGIFPLDFYIKEVKTVYTHQEWGFPKGRKNHNETDIDCAKREFNEETNIPLDDIKIIENIKPVEEVFVGSDGITYRYIYFIGLYMKDTTSFDIKVLHERGEIGDISWINYDNAVNLIRNYHVSRLHILTNLHTNIISVLINSINIKNIQNETSITNVVNPNDNTNNNTINYTSDNTMNNTSDNTMNNTNNNTMNNTNDNTMNNTNDNTINNTNDNTYNQ